MIGPNHIKSRRVWGSTFITQSKCRRGLATVLAFVVVVGASSEFFAPRGVQAATFTMTASDTGTGTSFNAAGHWNAGGAPAAGNSYYTSNFDLRTPTGGSVSVTFAGSSLEIDSGQPNGFIMKQSSGSAATIVVNNLIFNGGQLFNGNADNDNEFLSGSASITANSTVNNMDSLRTITLGSTLSGSANLSLLDGTLILTATNSTFSGKFNVNAGTLQFGDGATSPGSPGAVNISATGTVAFATPAGFNFVYSGSMNGSGGLAMKGAGNLIVSGSNGYGGATTISAGTLQLGNGGATGSLGAGGAITDTGMLAVSRSNSVTQGIDFSAGAITGSGSLVQMGPGTLTLNAANNYSGTTAVNGGALLLNSGSLNSSGFVSVAPGTTFGGSGSAGSVSIAAGGILQGGFGGAGSLSLAALVFNGSGSVNIGALVPSNTSTPVFSVGSVGLATSGTPTINITVGSLTGASSGVVYQLLSYGAIGGSGTPTFQLAPLPSRAVGFLSFPSGLIDLNITGADYLHWSGAVSSAWDTTSANWTLNSNGGTTTFINGNVSSGGDTVVFDNAAGPSHSSVNLTSTIYPGSVTISSSNSYTFSGSGSIGGQTAVTVNGPGSVTIATSNSYTGNTNVTGGVLNLASTAATLGNGTLILTGGTLDNTSGSPLVLSANNPLNWNANFTFLGSNPLNLGAGPLAISNSPTVFVSGSTLTAGGISSGAGALTKNGPGLLILSGSVGYTGATTVSAGTLALTNVGAPGSPSYAVAPGASLIMGATLPAGQTQSFSGDGTVIFAGANTLNINNMNFSGMNADSTLDFEFNGTDVALINSGGTPLASFLGTLNIGSSSSAQIGNVTIQCNVLTGGGTLGSPAARTIVLNVVGGATGTFSGNLSSANGAVVNLTLSGTGTQVFSGNNTALGTVTINSGVLNLQSPTAWIGVANVAATVSGNGALQLQNCGSLTGAATLNLGGTGVANDGALRNVAGNNTYGGPIVLQNDSRINSDSGLLTLTGGISGFGNLFFGGAGNISVPSNIIVTGALTMDGSGTLTLAGNNSYGGDTFVNSGSLLMNSGSLTSFANVSVAGGATFGGAGAAGAVTVASNGVIVGGYNGTGSLSLAALTFNGSGSVSIGSLATSNTSIPVISVGGDLTTSGANSITITVGSLAGATSGTIYQLIGYSGTLQGSGTSAFQLAPLPSRDFGFLSFPSGLVDLNVTGADYLHWSGSASSAWNTTSANWKLNSNGGTTTFINGNASNGGDTVVFDNAAGPGHSSVTLATTVYPFSVTVASSNNYTFSGSGSIGGPTAVTINGPGSATLATSNSYTGGTNVTGGVLNGGAANSFGLGALSVSGGTVNANNAQSSSSVNVTSGILNDGAANSFGPGALTVSGGTVSVNNAQSSSSIALSGSGLLTLASTAATLGSSVLTLSGGSLDNTSGSPLTLSANNLQNWNGSFTFIGSSGAPGLNLGAGAVAISNSPTVFVSGSTLTAAGGLSGASDLTKDGPGVLILSGVAGYNGATTVSNGTLALTNATLPTSTSFSVASGANLIFGATIASGQSRSFNGDGTVTFNGANTLNINNVSFSGMNSDSTLDFEFIGTDVALIGSGSTPLASFLGTLNIGSSSSAQIGNVTVQCNVLTGGGTLGCPVTRTIALNVVGGATGIFSGNLSAANGAVVNLTLNGTGTQILSGNNTGLATVAINSGVLSLQSSTAWIGVAASAATVSGNGALQLQNCGPLTSAATLNLGGTGVANDGALRNVAGNNTYSGQIVLQNDSRINSDSGLLTLAGSISGFGNLFFGGAGNIAIPSDIATSSGSLTMDGSGTLTLSGSNSYNGGTFVDSGIVIVTSPDALLDGSNLSVGPGAASLAPVVGTPIAAASAAAVPEPGTAALAAGLVLALRLRRRKPRQRCTI